MSSVCYYADLVVYFMMGVVLVLLWKQTPETPEKPRTMTQRAKIYVLAIIVGLLFAGLRFGMQKYCGHNTMAKVTSLLEDVTPVKLATVLESAPTIE